MGGAGKGPYLYKGLEGEGGRGLRGGGGGDALDINYYMCDRYLGTIRVQLA